MSHITGKLHRRKLLCVHKNSAIEKFKELERGECGRITTFRRKFVVSQYRRTTEKKPSVCSESFWYRKFLCKRWGSEGVSRLSVENLLSHGAKKRRRGISQCVRKVLKSNVFVDGRDGERERGNITIFFGKNLFHCTEKLHK